jgi:hypothetical protein
MEVAAKHIEDDRLIHYLLASIKEVTLANLIPDTDPPCR